MFCSGMLSVTAMSAQYDRLLVLYCRVDDTAFCIRKQPSRNYSRKALLFPGGDCQLGAFSGGPGLQNTPGPTPTFTRPGRCDEGAVPKFTVPRPFTAMRSPFAEPFAQKWANRPYSPTACGSTDSSSGSPPRSQLFSKSGDMDDLQSTVRCLNMC